MVDIIENLNTIIDKEDFSGASIGLFSIHFEFYEIAKILHNQGHLPSAILCISDVEKELQIMGIRLYSVKQFAEKYSDQAVIFLRESEYLIHKCMLSENGFIINKNVFVDCERKGFLYLLRLWIEEVKRKPEIFKHKVFGRCRALLLYAKAFWHQVKGYRIYKKIREKHPAPNLPIYIYDYSGMGDVYVFCLYLKANRGLIAPDGMILTVVGNVSKKVADMFQICDVVKLTKNESQLLTHLARFSSEVFNLHPMTPFPAHMHTDIYSHYLFGKRINMAEAYQYVMFSLAETKIEYPVLDTQPDKVKALFDKYNLPKGQTVIISPYANTIIGYPMEFWDIIIKRLKKQGFSVCTNCSGKEPALPGAPAFPFGLDIAEEVLDYAGYFLALRSGFCDVVCNSQAFKCILYPDYHIFNANVYEFCSLEKMGIGRNFVEICWDYSELETTLTDLVLKTFRHAMYFRTCVG